MRYPVKVMEDDNGTFLVTFPDVPEAVTYGDTIEEAMSRASDALLTIFDAYIKDRREVPQPSGLGNGPWVVVPALESAKIALYHEMRSGHVNKAELGRRLKWHLPQVDRLLNVRHGSQLGQIESAFRALGKHVEIVVHDQPAQAEMRHLLRARKRVARATGLVAHGRGHTVVRRAAKKR